MILEIQPIPKSSWGVSLAQLLSKEDWDETRKKCYENANHTCEYCLGKPKTSSGPMNAHEVWSYDYKKKVQTLVDVVCICQTCHDCVHLGRSLKVYKSKHVELLRRHLKEVNSLTTKELDNYIARVFNTHYNLPEVEFKVYAGGTRIK